MSDLLLKFKLDNCFEVMGISVVHNHGYKNAIQVLFFLSLLSQVKIVDMTDTIIHSHNLFAGRINQVSFRQLLHVLLPYIIDWHIY